MEINQPANVNTQTLSPSVDNRPKLTRPESSSSAALERLASNPTMTDTNGSITPPNKSTFSKLAKAFKLPSAETFKRIGHSMTQNLGKIASGMLNKSTPPHRIPPPEHLGETQRANQANSVTNEEVDPFELLNRINERKNVRPVFQHIPGERIKIKKKEIPKMETIAEGNEKPVLKRVRFNLPQEIKNASDNQSTDRRSETSDSPKSTDAVRSQETLTSRDNIPPIKPSKLPKELLARFLDDSVNLRNENLKKAATRTERFEPATGKTGEELTPPRTEHKPPKRQTQTIHTKNSKTERQEIIKANTKYFETAMKQKFGRPEDGNNSSDENYIHNVRRDSYQIQKSDVKATKKIDKEEGRQWKEIYNIEKGRIKMLNKEITEYIKQTPDKIDAKAPEERPSPDALYWKLKAQTNKDISEMMDKVKMEDNAKRQNLPSLELSGNKGLEKVIYQEARQRGMTEDMAEQHAIQEAARISEEDIEKKESLQSEIIDFFPREYTAPTRSQPEATSQSRQRFFGEIEELSPEDPSSSR